MQNRRVFFSPGELAIDDCHWIICWLKNVTWIYFQQPFNWVDAEQTEKNLLTALLVITKPFRLWVTGSKVQAGNSDFALCFPVYTIESLHLSLLKECKETGLGNFSGRGGAVLHFTCGGVGSVYWIWVQLIVTQETLDTLQWDAGLRHRTNTHKLKETF